MINLKEFLAGIKYLRSSDAEIQKLGIELFNINNICVEKIYSYFITINMYNHLVIDKNGVFLSRVIDRYDYTNQQEELFELFKNLWNEK